MVRNLYIIEGIVVLGVIEGALAQMGVLPPVVVDN